MEGFIDYKKVEDMSVTPCGTICHSEDSTDAGVNIRNPGVNGEFDDPVTTPVAISLVAKPYDLPLATPASEENFMYRMNHEKRGKFIIINNKIFEPQTKMSDRSGTDVDAENLYKLFTELRFEVFLHHNLTAGQMRLALEAAGAENHSDCDCFGLAILSHGEEGLLFGIDSQIYIEKLIAPIKNCQSLAGKPKLFFFQACRGQDLDEGISTSNWDEIDGKKEIRIPLEADFLYAYSTSPGYFSWRNSTNGSWFVQALYKVLSDKELRSKMDLARLLTRVSYIVAYQFESKSSSTFMNAKKQVPSIVSMLTKEIYFPE